MEAKGTVFLVDDDPSVRRGLARLLRSAGYTVRAFDSAEGYLTAEPDAELGCLVLDINLPGMDGLGLQVALACQDRKLPIIFITGKGDIPMTVQAIKTGAHDFLTKPVDGAALLRAVGAAMGADAEAYPQQIEAGRLRGLHDSLSQREREVFALLLTGKLNKQIGAQLGITEKTIKYHRGNVFQKFGITSVAQLVRIAQTLGIEAP